MAHHSAARKGSNPADPFVVDTRELGGRPGSSQQLRLSPEAPDGWSIDVIGVRAGSELDCDLRLYSVVEGILVTGEIRAETAGECVRCLEPIAGTLRVPVEEMWAFPDSTTDKTTEDEEVRTLDGDLLDLAPALRDALVLALPIAPLCTPECAGLCATCGIRLDDAPPGHGHDEIDPRWSALAELRTERHD